MRLISWTLPRGSEQFIYNWNPCGPRSWQGKGTEKAATEKGKTDRNTSRAEDSMHTIEKR
jgi:hypothetical protein